MDLINDAENAIALLIILVVFWIIWQYRSYFGFGNGSSGGVAQSAKNALQGFPDGGDPGTVPFAQDFQGFIESLRNASGYLFGSNDSGEYTQQQAASMNQLAASYQLPTQGQVNQAVQNANSFMNQDPLETNLSTWATQNGLF